MLERQDVGDGYLLLCSYCFDLMYAKHLKLKKRKTRILSFGARTFFFQKCYLYHFGYRNGISYVSSMAGGGSLLSELLRGFREP